MRKIWCFENLKIGEDSIAGKLKLFFLFFKMEREREEIGGERRAKAANQVRPRHPLAMGGAWPAREQRLLQAVGPTASPTASPSGLTAWAVLLHAPSVLQPVSWASEL